jgi:hypothetical protein
MTDVMITGIDADAVAKREPVRPAAEGVDSELASIRGHRTGKGGIGWGECSRSWMPNRDEGSRFAK